MLRIKRSGCKPNQTNKLKGCGTAPRTKWEKDIKKQKKTTETMEWPRPIVPSPL